MWKEYDKINKERKELFEEYTRVMNIMGAALLLFSTGIFGTLIYAMFSGKLG